jgi:hypothetical protein
MPAAERLALALAMCAGALLATGAHAAPPLKLRNVTAGGELRPGIYGRIEVRGEPPPVIYEQPIIATQALVPRGVKPVYLYVPPGQVRKWARYCDKWQACDEPVLFVRMDDSPSRLGQWRRLKESFALQRPD